jgi:hypothetical protein
MEFWGQGRTAPALVESVRRSDLGQFFAARRADLAPGRIYAAKTRGLFDRHCQLTFVDVGLMPMVEGEIGQRLTVLVERAVGQLTALLDWRNVNTQQGHWLLRSVFWLLAAKILHDKKVPSFSALDLCDVQKAFTCIAQHYGILSPVTIQGSKEAQSLSEVAAIIGGFADLGHVTTESLAYVYENTLISEQTRSDLGTHSTPSYLVDYLVWQLAPWIEEIPASERHVFEPACGHAAFLVSAMRLLRELLPRGAGRAIEVHEYLKPRLHGLDYDPFALEIARLSLTLADTPNPNGWDLKSADMFAGKLLQQRAKRSKILLANPPFENFRARETAEYPRLAYTNKAAEMLARTLPHLTKGAVFGVVIPQGLLHSKNARSLRQLLVRQFELMEICLFPDKVFKFSDMESAIIIGRRKGGIRSSVEVLRYCRVREPDVNRFKESYGVSAERRVAQERFAQDPACRMQVPDLEEVWSWCRAYPRFATIAQIGQGLSYRSPEALPKDAVTAAKSKFPGAVRGYAKLRENLMVHGVPDPVWMSLDPMLIQRPRSGAQTGMPQVLLNYARVSRGPWRLKAFIDLEGRAVTSSFITIRPRGEGLSLEFLWALCNSPFANAYVHAHTMQRAVLVGLIRGMPVPLASRDEVEGVADAARAYLQAVSPADDSLVAAVDEDLGRMLIARMDAEVLRLYQLPPRLERELLDLFAGEGRRGVPFEFLRYFSEDFEPCFSLHDYLSDEFQRSTAGELRKRFEPLKSSALLKGLRRATEDFGE